MNLKKAAAELIAVIVFVVIIGSVALVIGNTQKKNADKMTSEVVQNAWLLGGN